MRINVLGVDFDNLTLQEAVDSAVALLSTGSFHYAVTPNPEFLLTAEKQPEFRAALNEADLSLPDGIGIVYASRILGRPLKGRTPGIDFAGELMARIAPAGGRVFLLGAKPGIAEQAASRLAGRYPGLVVCGAHDGYFQEDEPVVKAIQEARPDLLLVCLGAPKQELWMRQYGPSTGAHLAVGLGGALDVFAGAVRRAPAVWQRLGLEWLFRLIRDPRRIGRMSRLPAVLWYALLARLSGK